MPLPARDASALDRLFALAAEHGFPLHGARICRTSSRFCLGVEHGDYNGTELFGVGTDRFLWLAAAPNDRRSLRVASANFADEGAIEIPFEPRPVAGALRGWARYPAGVIATLLDHGYPLRRGVDLVVFGDIPGGGMSRSASLCVNLILSIAELEGFAIEPRFRVAELAQIVENVHIGSPCGLLDQTMILFARAGHGTHFDPATRAITHVPLGAATDDFRLVALDTGTVRPGLETSTYRVRRAECEKLVGLARDAGFGIRNLADVRDDAMLAALRACFGPQHPALLDRLDYLFAAQRNFATMLDAWRHGDLATVGELFRADGRGLRDRYRISGPELESMCDIARTVPGVLGERMLGGGDKGAAGAIVRADAVAALRDAVALAYPRSHPEFADRHRVHELALVDGVVTLTA